MIDIVFIFKRTIYRSDLQLRSSRHFQVSVALRNCIGTFRTSPTVLDDTRRYIFLGSRAAINRAARRD